MIVSSLLEELLTLEAFLDLLLRLLLFLPLRLSDRDSLCSCLL